MEKKQSKEAKDRAAFFEKRFEEAKKKNTKKGIEEAAKARQQQQAADGQLAEALAREEAQIAAQIANDGAVARQLVGEP